MKPESKFWQQVKKNTVKTASPPSAILYKSSAIHELQSNIRDAKIAAQDDWTAIQEALIGGD
jgi:hypothetical protein